MTRYHVLASDQLMAEPDLHLPEGFRFIEPSGPGDDGFSRWWLCEDDDAPAELEQHRVEVVFTRGQVTEDGPHINAVTERHIVNAQGIRVREVS